AVGNRRRGSTAGAKAPPQSVTKPARTTRIVLGDFEKQNTDSVFDATYDLPMPGTAFFAKFGGLYPAYVRGLAYLEARRGGEAAAEFQKVLDHRGIVLADPIGALAHLQLGRALGLLGERDRAARAYQDLLAVW